MLRSKSVFVSELDLPDQDGASRFMAVYYGPRIRVALGSSYFEAMFNLIKVLGTASRRAR